MSVLRIHLIRHGETDWNREKRVQGQSESQLTRLGRQQAIALAAQLATLPLQAVYCSSSRRTQETAALLFAASVQVTLMDALREIFLGAWEGQLQASIREQYSEQFNNFWHQPQHFQLAGAEDFHQIQQRALTAFEVICQQHLPAGEIAIVSHGVWIKSLLCAIEPRPLAELWQPPVMANCAHSIVEIRGQHRYICQYAAVVPPDPDKAHACPAQSR